MPNQKNQQQLDMLKDKLTKAKAVAIVNYEGTTVADQVTLRAKLQAIGAEFLVAKNTLINLTLDKAEFAESLEGMNGIVFSYEDEVAGFKELVQFHKDTEKLTIRQGLLDDRVLSADQIAEISKLPSKTELIGVLMARLQSPAFGLVNVLKAGQRNLVYVLKAIADKQG